MLTYTLRGVTYPVVEPKDHIEQSNLQWVARHYSDPAVKAEAQRILVAGIVAKANAWVAEQLPTASIDYIAEYARQVETALTYCGTDEATQSAFAPIKEAMLARRSAIWAEQKRAKARATRHAYAGGR